MSLIAYLLAVLLPALAIYSIYWLDIFSTGRGTTIGYCWLWGLTGAFLGAYTLNTALQRLFALDTLTIATRYAPLTEELLKALVLLYWINQPRFRYFVDGAVYGYAVGVGFAMAENLFYLANSPDNLALGLALSRFFSVTLMHATAGAVIGIGLGYGRRVARGHSVLVGISGFVIAVALHSSYNNLLSVLAAGPLLLLGGVCIGGGGAVCVGWLMRVGLRAEQRRFAESLSIQQGISRGERHAVQQLGSDAISAMLTELTLSFGAEKAALIRRLLVLQANIGILRHNLQSPASHRLRDAWTAELDALTQEMDSLRRQLGSYTMTRLRTLIPSDRNAPVWAEFTRELADYDPLQVYAYDLFLMASDRADMRGPDEITRISQRLGQMAIFQHVTAVDLDNLSRAITRERYSHRDTLFRKGDQGDALYLIDTGYIDVLTPDANGHDQVLRTYQGGDVIGDLALLDGQPRSTTARANGPLMVLRLERQDFLRFVQSRPSVILAILRYLADRVRYVTDAMSGIPEGGVLSNIPQQAIASHISPQATDTSLGSNAPMGVFGRLSAMLEALDQPTSPTTPQTNPDGNR